jgi:4-amino-4-deoxy-L-arabinose transferase-like glycosyltransferase
LRLCVYATVALLGWLLGPFALLFFACLGFAGYWQARREGLSRSKCLLRDTRLVLGYLAALGVVAAAGVYVRLV